MRCLVASILLMMLLALVPASAEAQRTNRQQPKRQPEKPPAPQMSDRRLYDLHVDFIRGAEKLAKEYLQKAKDARLPEQRRAEYEKARMVAKQMLKMVPEYTPAEDILTVIANAEATEGTVEVEITADKDWQDTKVDLIAGKPVSIKATGSWVLKLEYRLSADGLDVKKELKDLKIGGLIGVIYTGGEKPPKPFMVGAEKELVPKENGRLLLKMHDGETADNEGELTVTITGTFNSKLKK